MTICLTLHEDLISLNCYKIRLTAALLSIPYKRKSYSTLKGETRTPEFLENVNRFGRIPVLEIKEDSKDSIFLPESDAACFYLADNAAVLSRPTQNKTSHRLIPPAPLQRAQMMRWLFFEQNQHEVSVATLRFWTKYLGGPEKLDSTRRMQYDLKRTQAEDVLGCMEEHLGQSRQTGSGWFVVDHEDLTLADVVLFAYTHMMHEGGVKWEKWPEIKAWCGRVREVDGFEEAGVP